MLSSIVIAVGAIDKLYKGGDAALAIMLISFVLALMVSLIVTPMVRQWAIAKGKYDLPGGRKIHEAPTPRMGGIAIACGFLIPIILVLLLQPDWLSDKAIQGTILGAAIMFFVGLMDDLYDLSPYIKLLGQFLAVLTAFALGVQINALDLPFSLLILLQSFALPVTLMWLIGLTNAMNFIDGVDGLAGGITVIAAVSFAFVAFYMQEPIPAILALLLAGGTLGFLVFNFSPAKIFMGDGGALLCGFILAAIAVIGVLKTLTMFLFVPLLILTVPIIDITFATLRRLVQGKSPFVADASHIHHRLLGAGFTKVWTVFSLYLVCIIGGAISAYYINRLMEYLVVMGLLIVLSGVLILIRRQFTAFIPGMSEIDFTSTDVDSLSPVADH